LSRAAVLAVLAASLTAGAAPEPVASSSGLCEPLNATVHAQLQVAAGTLVLQGVLEGTLGRTSVIGSSVATLTTPIQGVGPVDNPQPTQFGSQDEVVDEAKAEPPKTFATVGRGVFVPTTVKGAFLLVVNARVVGDGSGEIHYRGTVDLESSTAVWEMSGALCL
jgi:hypothetical protein